MGGFVINYGIRRDKANKENIVSFTNTIILVISGLTKIAIPLVPYIHRRFSLSKYTLSLLSLIKDTPCRSFVLL